MREDEKIKDILDSFIACTGNCEKCIASQEFDGVQICYLLLKYRGRLLNAVTKIVEKM